MSRKADRQKIPPYGLFGGKAGAPGIIIKYPDTDRATVIDSKKSNNVLESGHVLRCSMPGAGGYGDPMERDKALIVHDLEEGYISVESAIQDYGMTEEEIKNIDIFTE